MIKKKDIIIDEHKAGGMIVLTASVTCKSDVMITPEELNSPTIDIVKHKSDQLKQELLDYIYDGDYANIGWYKAQLKDSLIIYKLSGRPSVEGDEML